MELFLADYSRISRPTFQSCFFRCRKIAEFRGLAVPSRDFVRRELGLLPDQSRVAE
ncbi:DNA-binding domain-containing protein [Cereibacter johrii]